MNLKPPSIWHPMTQHALFPDSIYIERASGAYLYTRDGREILDGISSWWVNTHGHCHPKIVEAVQAQAGKLEQVIFAGFTHEPAEALTEKLLAQTDKSFGTDALEHVFYSDSGSTAIEVALKMAIGYFEHKGKPRRKILALEGGYHGDTFGAMSTGERSVFNALYEPFLFEVEHLPFPHAGAEHHTLEALERILKREGDQVAAFIFEPLMQGAAGMQIYSAATLKNISDLCKAYGVLLIADEVMTGFGRLGSFFACEEATIAPDFLCLSKGLTGGFLPMGATVCSADIYKAFYHKDRTKMFFHSTSFTGNALACAAGLASFGIWEDEPVMDRIGAISRAHAAAAVRFKKRADVKAVRHKGSILALDIVDGVQGYLSALGPRLYEEILACDVLLRPIGNTIYILPPYCVSAADLEKIYSAIEAVLDKIQATASKT